MPITIKGETYYRISEACQMVGIARSTLLRWVRLGVVKDVPHRDRRGWRLFTEADVKRIADEANKVK